MSTIEDEIVLLSYLLIITIQIRFNLSNTEKKIFTMLKRPENSFDRFGVQLKKLP